MKHNLAQLIYKMALEEAATGVVGNEIEYVYYARLKDVSILDKATAIEDQEQWTIKLDKTPKTASPGTLRVRKTTVDSKTEFVLSIKIPQESLQDVNIQSNTQVPVTIQNMREVALEATEDAFELFKRLSSNGMVKTRYCLPVEGSDLVLEVDRFKLPNGEYSEWVKIDIEVKSPLVEKLQLPEAFTEVVYNQKNEQTQEEKDFVWNLYENVFLTKNVFLK
jgi:CYTH domain-containing protein